MTDRRRADGGGPDAWKRRAATAAVAEVADGMVLGLGSGSTAMLAVEALAARIASERLRIVAIPTSRNTATLARRLGVPLTGFADQRRIDLTIDGADQIEAASLTLLKGLGGALLREKIVAAASRRMVVVADQGKLVDRLDHRTPLPVEIVTFGWEPTLDRLTELGAATTLRMGPRRRAVRDRWRELHRRLPIRPGAGRARGVGAPRQRTSRGHRIGLVRRSRVPRVYRRDRWRGRARS